MPTTLELPDELSEMLKDNAKYCDEIMQTPSSASNGKSRQQTRPAG